MDYLRIYLDYWLFEDYNSIYNYGYIHLNPYKLDDYLDLFEDLDYDGFNHHFQGIKAPNKKGDIVTTKGIKPRVTTLLSYNFI